MKILLILLLLSSSSFCSNLSKKAKSNRLRLEKQHKRKVEIGKYLKKTYKSDSRMIPENICKLKKGMSGKEFLKKYRKKRSKLIDKLIIRMRTLDLFRTDEPKYQLCYINRYTMLNKQLRNLDWSDKAVSDIYLKKAMKIISKYKDNTINYEKALKIIQKEATSIKEMVK